VAELSGKELQNYLEFVIFNLTAGSGSFPQMNGVEIKAIRETKKITELKINGAPLSETKKYLVALPEFIAGGGDKYPKLTYRKTGFIDADVLKDFILSAKELKSQDYAPRSYIRIE
jgi:5'-nucleotidase/UDP-sugar diphosphatase